MPDQADTSRRQCSLLLFLAVPAEEEALVAVARERGFAIETVTAPGLGTYHWLGQIGNETVIAVCPTRERGRVTMGPLGRLGSAAKAMRFQQATGAQAILQLGMAFGIERQRQQLGDVLVSTSLIPYDNRWVKPGPGGGGAYVVDYSQATREPARQPLIDLFLREQSRGGHPFGIHVGAILSGAARISSGRFRDELREGVPAGEDPISGGEMEGVGLLAASMTADDPIWCVIKGICDFADEKRDQDVQEGRPLACGNAARLVFAALVNDAAR